MFTVSSTLIWAVLTGPADWVCHTVRRGGCLEFYYCNMVEWSWWDSSFICKTNWFPSVLWHCWFGHMTCKDRPQNEVLWLRRYERLSVQNGVDVKPLHYYYLLFIFHSEPVVRRKRGDYRNCSVLYCVLKLCTVISTLKWVVLTVLCIGFSLTGPISLCINFSINLFRHTQQIYTIYKTKVTKTFILCVTGSTQGA